MQAVILAGGKGSRLGRFTDRRPKCLVEVGGKPLIKHQLEALADHGVGPILLVLGHQADAVRDAVGDAAEYIVNERYAETNSLYSLWLAREWVKGPFLLLNCDLLFHPEIPGRLLEERGSVLAFDSTSINGREQTKVAIRQRRVVDLGKDVPSEVARGESLGMLKFDADAVEALFESVEALVMAGQEKSWATEAVRTACSRIPLYTVNIAGLPWVEVDFPFDLERARREVWPAISRSRSRSAVLRRRAAWSLMPLLALGLGAGGWYSNNRVGPASVDWENASSVGAEVVDLTTTSGPQPWWKIAMGDAVEAEVEGVDVVRIEVRLLLPPETRAIDRGRYVVQVSVDGEPVDWEVFKGTPDPAVSLEGFVVADRDRLERTGLTLDRHAIAVSLLAGTADQMLVRIRHPE